MFRLTALLLLIALSWSAHSAHAQESIDEAQWARGYHGFAALCRAVGLTPTDDPAAWRRVPATRSLLVILGAVERLPVEVEGYLRRGGAVLIASDRGDDGTLRPLGLDLLRGPQLALRRDAALHGYPDCPLVTAIDPDHPLTRGVRVVPTNRPGALRVIGPFNRSRQHNPRWRILARLPVLRGRPSEGSRRPEHGPPFMASVETAAGGRAVVLADQTVLANQMLFYGDNARLAVNVLRWLGDDTRRTTVLILDDRKAVVPPAPQLVDVEIPPPSPQDVNAALSNLPPDLLVEFGNILATTVQEEGLADDLLAVLVRSIPQRDYHRLLVLVPTVLLGLFVVRQLFSRAAAEGTVLDRDGAAHPISRRRAALERQHAAAALLHRFRTETAGTSDVAWETLAAGLRIPDQPRQAVRLRRRLVRAGQRLGPRGPRYWTRRRLRQLDVRIRDWRRLRESGILEYRG